MLGGLCPRVVSLLYPYILSGRVLCRVYIWRGIESTGEYGVSAFCKFLYFLGIASGVEAAYRGLCVVVVYIGGDVVFVQL